MLSCHTCLILEKQTRKTFLLTISCILLLFDLSASLYQEKIYGIQAYRVSDGFATDLFRGRGLNFSLYFYLLRCNLHTKLPTTTTSSYFSAKI